MARKEGEKMTVIPIPWHKIWIYPNFYLPLQRKRHQNGLIAKELNKRILNREIRIEDDGQITEQ